MVSRIHYSEDMLQRLLSDRLGRDEADVTAHVEACDTCQTRLESLCQSGLSWEDVAELLKPDEASQSNSASVADPPGSHQTPFLEPSERPGTLGRFARYEVTEVLGRGGMGIVMRGFDPALNRHSAIKVLAPELASSAAARKRFSREAKSAAAVVHPHVVPIQTVDEHNGLPYLVMPVVEGRSLEDRVRQQGPLELIETVRIAGQVAEGLAAAHAQGLVHRDIKPANVLLENGLERVMITDFGLARAADDASLTRSGTLAGTPQYMSPEQAHGDEIDHRSDLFSLGSLIYFMCTGRSPFRAETTMGVLNRIVNDTPRSLRSINPDIPAWLEQIVFRLLAKQPDDRFQSASEVAELLDKWQAHLQQPDQNPPPKPISSKGANGPPKSRWRKWLAGASAAGLLLVASIVIVLEMGKGTVTIESAKDGVPIRIRKGDTVVKKMTVSQGQSKTRVAAGEYVVEIDADDTELHVLDKKITLTRGGEEVVRIIRSPSPPVALPVGAGRGDTFPREEDDRDGFPREGFGSEMGGYPRQGGRGDMGMMPQEGEGGGYGTGFGKEREASVVGHPPGGFGRDALPREGGGGEYRRDGEGSGARVGGREMGYGSSEGGGRNPYSVPRRSNSQNAAQGDHELSTPNATTGGSKQVDSRAIQVRFIGPRGLMVSDDPPSAEEAIFISLPHNVTYRFGETVPLSFRDMGYMFGGTLELLPVEYSQRRDLKLNAFPIRITEEDLFHIRSNEVVKHIVYVPDASITSKGGAGIDSIASSRLEPETDVLAEAKRRGTPLAILTLRHTDPAEEKTNDSEGGSVSATDEESIQPPEERAVLKALERERKLKPGTLLNLYDEHRSKFRIVKERLQVDVGPLGDYPLIGQAQVRRTKWRYTIHFDETPTVMWPLSHKVTQDELVEVVNFEEQALVPLEGTRAQHHLRLNGARSAWPLKSTTD